ncbi:hypothetical protein EJB05_46683, partial [Eragrostis curvula]
MNATDLSTPLDWPCNSFSNLASMAAAPLVTTSMAMSTTLRRSLAAALRLSERSVDSQYSMERSFSWRFCPCPSASASVYELTWPNYWTAII